MIRRRSPVAVSVGITKSSFPRSRMPMQMQHREYGDDVRFRQEEDAVRKIVQQCAPGAFLNGGKLKRILDESGEHPVDLRLEAEPET